MKNEKRKQAEHLYFQTNMSKTQIAKVLGISRRTLILWSHRGNWETLRQSARHMPSLVAEKCYHLLDHYASQFLLDGAPISTFDQRHADAINKLASSIKKLKNRNTLNESMELFNFFYLRLKEHDAALADKVLPHIERFIHSRSLVTANDFLLEEFNKDGLLPYPVEQIKETNQDRQDARAFSEELEKTGSHKQAVKNWLHHTASAQKPAGTV